MLEWHETQHQSVTPCGCNCLAFAIAVSCRRPRSRPTTIGVVLMHGKQSAPE